ncbi:unnamed protein product [Paramecium sonneborni]|uniref:TRAFD1/XAF1 zinc finger domain-containing protein n=1 Tax=Paramecium sonneborni TaxID=65129 RepID=A0A8S1NBI5_9CILI|nr:unnamed protein product [Paramecium sonneborni]
MNEITIQCSNCRQPIAESKHMLHETYCLRNNIKCLKCGQFYDKNDPESHEEEYHKKEKCQHCSQEFEDLKKHKCIKKPKQCMHCDLSFPIDQIFQHENQCGSRTQKCEICNNYVMIKDYQNHLKTCQPKAKVEPSLIQKKPTSQEIFDKPNYDKFDDRIDQQKFNSKKETQQQYQSQSQTQEKQFVQQQQQTRPQVSGYKYNQAAREGKTQYQLKDEDKNNKQKDGFRPPSSNNQTASRNQPQQQITTQISQQKQQTNQTQNQRQQNNSQKEEKAYFDNQYERQQYINKQQQSIQPQTQQQQKQNTSSYSQIQKSQQQFNNQNKRTDLKRPDTAIAREIQKQMELEEEFGISSEEYLLQQQFNQKSHEQNQQQPPPIQKVAPPQPMIPAARIPQNHDNQEFDIEGISEEEKYIQQQIMESLKFNQKKR